jgi:hypothetical protein
MPFDPPLAKIIPTIVITSPISTVISRFVVYYLKFADSDIPLGKVEAPTLKILPILMKYVTHEVQ